MRHFLVPLILLITYPRLGRAAVEIGKFGKFIKPPGFSTVEVGDDHAIWKDRDGRVILVHAYESAEAMPLTRAGFGAALKEIGRARAFLASLMDLSAYRISAHGIGRWNGGKRQWTSTSGSFRGWNGRMVQFINRLYYSGRKRWSVTLQSESRVALRPEAARAVFDVLTPQVGAREPAAVDDSASLVGERCERTPRTGSITDLVSASRAIDRHITRKDCSHIDDSKIRHVDEDPYYSGVTGFARLMADTNPLVALPLGCAEGVGRSAWDIVKTLYDLARGGLKLTFDSRYRDEVFASLESVMGEAVSNPKAFFEKVISKVMAAIGGAATDWWSCLNLRAKFEAACRFLANLASPKWVPVVLTKGAEGLKSVKVVNDALEKVKFAFIKGTPKELKGLNAKMGEKYDEIARLNEETRPMAARAAVRDVSAADEPALASKQATLAAREKEVRLINERRHQLLERIREADSGSRLGALRLIEEKLSPLKNRLREAEARIARLELIQKQAGAAERFEIKRQIDQLKKLRAVLNGEIAPLQTRWSELARRSPPEARLKQLTGRDIEPGKAPSFMETPDPTIYRSADDKVILMGSGQRYFEYDSMHQFLRGDPGRAKVFDVRYPDGTKMNGPYHTGELPWDLSIVRYENGQEVMYGGALSPKKFRQGGLATDAANTSVTRENWTRSGHAFVKKVAFTDPATGKEAIYESMEEFVKTNRDKGSAFLAKAEVKDVWVRSEKDIFGRKIPMDENWDGHNYGRRVVTNSDGSVWRDENGDAWVMYEKVVGRGKALGDTKMFAQRMKNPFEVKGEPVEIQGTSFTHVDPATGRVTEHRFPSTVRSIDRGLTLVEGPNPAQGKITSSDMPKLTRADVQAFRRRFKGTELEGVDPRTVSWRVVGGATGDYATDEYAMIFGVRPVTSNMPRSTEMGKLTPLTKGAGAERDIRDFADQIRGTYGISWGPSRPDLFKDESGRWWVMFHGIDESVVPSRLNPRRWPSDAEIDSFHRNVYIAPVRWKMVDGLPQPEIIDGSSPIGKLPLIVAPVPTKKKDERETQRSRDSTNSLTNSLT